MLTVWAVIPRSSNCSALWASSARLFGGTDPQPAERYYYLRFMIVARHMLQHATA